LTSLLLALTQFLRATRFFRLTRLLLLPQSRGFFLTCFLQTFFLLLLALSTPRLLLRTLLFHAFCRRTPQGFCGVVPALLAEVARIRHVRAASPAFARRTTNPHDEERTACRHN
jgi:hypothetical protein